MSFKKIFCPVDFSPGSAQALKVAVRLANEKNAELTIGHSWHIPPSALSEYTFPPEVIQQIHDDAELGLANAVRDATAAGAKNVSSELMTGVPWVAITQQLEEGRYDLVVIGTHGRTGIARVLLGSVAEKVLRHSPCSVLVVRPDSQVAQFNHVLCPVDFSKSSHEAMFVAGELASRGGAGVTLLHSIELPVTWVGEPPTLELSQDLDRQAATLLAGWTHELKSRIDIPVNSRSRIGKAGRETLAVLDEDKSIDLVVMGSHGRTGIKRALLGSVAEKIARHARCPVLVTRRRS